MNRTLAKLAVAAVAPLILVSAVTLTSGVASAKASVPTISCTDLTGTVSWNPPLVPGTATSKTTQITFTGLAVSGCTTNPASKVTAAASVTATASLTTHGNSCESLIKSTGAPTTYTFVIDWNGGGGTSTFTFKGSHTSTSPPSLGLSPGKGTGAFPTTKAAVVAYPNPTGIADLAQCIGDTGKPLSSVTIVGGSVTA